MNKNVRVAKELVRLAKSLVAAEYGEAYYKIYADKSLSVSFKLAFLSYNKFLGWMDAMLSNSEALKKMSGKYGYTLNENTVADPNILNDNGLTFSMFFDADENSDQEGFINELVKTYQAKEIK